MADLINPYHYRDPADEQQRWQQLFTEQAARNASSTPVGAVADRVVANYQLYPWLDLPTITALVQAGGNDQTIAQIAQIDADAKGRHS